MIKMYLTYVEGAWFFLLVSLALFELHPLDVSSRFEWNRWMTLLRRARVCGRRRRLID